MKPDATDSKSPPGWTKEEALEEIIRNFDKIAVNARMIAEYAKRQTPTRQEFRALRIKMYSCVQEISDLQRAAKYALDKLAEGEE